LKVEYCDFPDDIYYDVRNDVWFRKSLDGKGGGGTAGITSILSFLAGKLQKVTLRTELKELASGQMFATIESKKYFGPVRSPLGGKIGAFNTQLASDPLIASREPYESGWFVRYDSYSEEDLAKLLRGKEAEIALRMRIKELKVRCFAELPDDEMFSIGTECSTTLANLNQLLEKRPTGTVVHLVTDDPTSDIEMIRWSDQTKNDVLESRKEDNLFHFVVKKKGR